MNDTNKNQNDFVIPDAAEFSKNMVKVAASSQQLLSDFLKRNAEGPGPGGFDPLNVGSAFADLFSQMLANPQALVDAQFKFWQAHMNLWHATVRRMMGEDVDPVVTPERGDRRWKHEDWAQNQVFDFIKQSYLLSAQWLQSSIAEIEGIDPHTRNKIDFYTKQFVDALSPTNFALTNPEVLRATLASNGENLAKGFENLLEDLERGKGTLWVRQTDFDAFKVGETLAATPGKIVYQNDLMQLIQYEPLTKTVYERPLLVIPPWINKFYILDMRPENSFIRWALSKGYTVFVVSWVNPDERHVGKTFESYMTEGIYEALDAVERSTGRRDVNAIGYCIGGTLLTCALAHMADNDDDRIKSATFFAAQSDFSDAGELKVFIDDVQLDALEAGMEARGGYLDGVQLATTFNMLRANDLIWSFVVNNYLLGKEPFQFDLLYWNSDQTRMPQKMQMFYLREFYRDNKLARGMLELGGQTLDLKKIKIPIYLQSSREDHIAPYQSVYKTTQLVSGPVRFICAGSGHIAGVINHPDAKKYQYWTNADTPANINDWWDGAEEHPGSWWSDWHEWLSKKSGKKVAARSPGDNGLNTIEDAPGSYVLQRSA